MFGAGSRNILVPHVEGLEVYLCTNLSTDRNIRSYCQFHMLILPLSPALIGLVLIAVFGQIILNYLSIRFLVNSWREVLTAYHDKFYFIGTLQVPGLLFNFLEDS